jgi:hypothetical protein
MQISAKEGFYHGYDNIVTHFERLTVILDQLNQSQEYTDVDYVRFRQAAEHNRNLLTQFADAWPQKLKSIKEQL